MGMAENYPRTLLELERRFATEEACAEYLFALRWPDGFTCPACGGRKSWKMERRLWLCAGCRRQCSVTAGTVFQDSHLPLSLWFRAMWHVTSHKNGVSALGIQRVLGLGSYKTAWLMLHKLRRAMVRPDRDRLSGIIEVDEAYLGGKEEGVAGRLTVDKALVFVAVEVDGKGAGRVRLHRIAQPSRAVLHAAIADAVEPGSTVRSDGLNAYLELQGYQHERHIQRHQDKGDYVLPRVHLVISLFKRWLLGTHQGAVSHAYLDDYLNEFVFRFNRRKSASRGKLFYRLAQQAVQIEPVTAENLATHNI